MNSFRKTVALVVLFVAGAAAPAADQPVKLADESVIYPRNAPAAGTSTPRSDDGFPIWGMLTVMAVLAGGGFYLLKRGGLGSRSAGAGGQRLAIEETRPLGNKQFLAVATYGERKLLLAVCAGRIDLLCRLDETGPRDAAPGGELPKPRETAPG